MNIRATCRSVAAACGALLAFGATLPAEAQYKVVGPDGKVTYTDRQPAGSEGRVVPLGNRAAADAAPADADLPFELRQVTGKYPVTLYTVVGACEPCASGRTMLRQRGIPFSEKQVVSQDDSDALEKLAGAREAPVVTIGPQLLKGYSPEVWASYLDAAGYPRASRLPATYAWRTPTPIVERQVQQRPPTSQGAAPAAIAATPPATPQPSGAGGIRF